MDRVLRAMVCQNIRLIEVRYTIANLYTSEIKGDNKVFYEISKILDKNI